MWSKTASYLAERMPRNVFTIVPLGFNEIGAAVRRGDVDFIITNPEIYVDLEAQYGVTRIATLMNRTRSGPFKIFGGVIFVKADRKDLQNLQDLKGRKFMAVQSTSLGGWAMAWREFKADGIDPYNDFAELLFGGTHDAVVYAVRDGRVDAGTVRTDTLERMHDEGKIDKAGFRTLNPRKIANFPFALSTRVYPEWPFAKVRHTRDDIAQAVAIALMNMRADDPAALAANIEGWTIPLDYQPVHELMKELRIGVYKDYGKITLSSALKQYWPWLMLALVLILLMVLITVYVVRLNRMLRDRTSELISAKEAAEAANRAKSDFLSSMSHELRTPLNAILGYAQILRGQGNLTDRQRQQLDILRGSGEHLLTLINDILDVGKIEARKMELEERPFNLPILLRQVFNIIKFKAEEKDLLFQYETLTPLPEYVRQDERKLRQILLNLLSNAIKYTRRGRVTLRVSYGQAGPGILRSEVVDSGVGIPQQKLDTIFEPFTQVVTEGEPREGTGLGLTITKQLVSLMQGRLGVQSEVGKGSTFWFEVPMPEITETGRAVEEVGPAIIGYNGERKRVLVVDDNIHNASMLVSVLEPLGFQIAVAENGLEAVRKAMDQIPDLVILDLVMPEMDGLEAAREIRGHSELSGARIIGASATVSDSARKEAFMSACNDFVGKPFRIDLLLEKIREQLLLEWDTEPTSVPLTEAAVGKAEEGRFQVPSPEEMEKVYELALRGDLRGVYAWATEIEEMDKRFTPFAARLRQFAGGFKAKAVLELVEQYRGEKNER